MAKGILGWLHSAYTTVVATQPENILVYVAQEDFSRILSPSSRMAVNSGLKSTHHKVAKLKKHHSRTSIRHIGKLDPKCIYWYTLRSHHFTLICVQPDVLLEQPYNEKIFNYSSATKKTVS